MWTSKRASPVNFTYSSVPIALAGRSRGSGVRPFDEKIPARAAEIHPPRVLIVDDEPLVRWSLAETLSRAGYAVAEAGTSQAARAALHDAGTPVSAMVLDLKLPDGPGLDVLEEARRTNQFCPVVVITAYGSPEVVARALTLGAAAIVSKPFDLDHLLGIVQRICPLSH
jgi:DNA-binding NtrC family response regulator